MQAETQRTDVGAGQERRLGREETHVCAPVTDSRRCADVWQKPTTYHKAVILQLKTNK